MSTNSTIDTLKVIHEPFPANEATMRAYAEYGAMIEAPGCQISNKKRNTIRTARLNLG